MEDGRFMTLRASLVPLLASLAFGALLIAPGIGKAESIPYATLLGSWGGTGEIRLDQNRKERIKCKAYYTGGGVQLGLAIRCQSESYKIEIRSKLSYSGGRLTGNWEERTFNAAGTATGSVSDSDLKLAITGPVTGSMNISFTKSRQNVSISTQGTALEGVNITLGRS
jgi:hypothetical protein